MFTKKFFRLYPFIFWPLLFLSLIILHWQSFNNFFFGDDFFNIKLSIVSSLKEALNFFNLVKSPPSFPFYRPLTIQFYFWLGYKIFGLNPIGYHIFNFSFFLISLICVYKLVKKITNNLTFSYLTVFFYSFSSSHFSRLFWVSLIQEIALSVFYLSAIIFYFNYIKTRRFKNYIYTIVFFVLSMVSKETAITLPFALIVVDFLFLKKENFVCWIKTRLKILSPFLLLLTGYLFFRIFFFGFSRGDDYQFIFTLKSIANNLLWYVLWGLGFPEHFVNLSFFEFPTIINLKFFTDFGEYGLRTSFFLMLFIFCLILGSKVLIDQPEKKNLRLIIFAFFWIVVTLAPVLFFPFHKFAYSTTLPLFGVAIVLAILSCKIFKFSSLFFLIFMFSFFLGSYNSWRYAYITHWSVKRPKVAKRIFDYFKTKFPQVKEEDTFYFLDTTCLYCCQKTPAWSREISYILSDGKGLEILYLKKPKIYFQEFTSIYEVEKEKVNFIYSGVFFDNQMI